MSPSSPVLNQHLLGQQSIDRHSLKDQATALLRKYIVTGRILPGTKLVEREIATLLGVSRMPARDALMDLEREGLIVTKSNGRYAVELNQEDIEHLFQVRQLLEQLAVELAVQNITAQNAQMLRDNLDKMRNAIAQNDKFAYVAADLEAHHLIWAQSGNPHLQRMLHSITGPIFMFIASQTEFQTDWNETLQLHIELADAICAGALHQSVQSIKTQMENSRQLSIRVFGKEM